MKTSMRLVALVIVTFLSFAACAAEKVENVEPAFIAKYGQLMLDEERIHSKDASPYASFDVTHYRFAKIETEDRKVFYEVVFPNKGEPNHSYVVMFQEDFASKYVTPVLRGFAGNADEEIAKFKAYQGKIMDLGGDN